MITAAEAFASDFEFRKAVLQRLERIEKILNRILKHVETKL